MIEKKKSTVPDTSQSKDRECNSFQVGFPIAHLWDRDWQKKRGCLRVTSYTWRVLEENLSACHFLSQSGHESNSSFLSSCVFPFGMGESEDNVPFQDGSFKTEAAWPLWASKEPSLLGSSWISLVDFGRMLCRINWNIHLQYKDRHDEAMVRHRSQPHKISMSENVSENEWDQCKNEWD